MAFQMSMPDFDAENIQAALKQIKSWMHQLNDNLKYALSHIEEENFTSALKGTLDGKLDSNGLKSLTEAIERNRADIESCVSEAQMLAAIRVIKIGGVNLISHDARHWQQGAWGISERIVDSGVAIAYKRAIDVTPGESLTVNSYCEHDMYLSFYDASGARIAGPVNTGGLVLPVTLEAPANAVRLCVHCVKSGGAYPHELESAFKYKLERGNKSTDWSRALDDDARGLRTLASGSVPAASIRNAESSTKYREVDIDYSYMNYASVPALTVSPYYSGTIGSPFVVGAYIREITAQGARVRMASNYASINIIAGLKWIALGEVN